MNRPLIPVSPDELYNAVAGCTTQDPAQVTASAQRLKELLDLHGAFDCLSAIAAQRTVPLVIRQQAIIQFKNNALNHWRARRLVSEAHKTEIHGRCLTFLDEEDDVIADCNKIITAKIARSDYPHTWENLIPDLISSIEGALGSFLSSGGNDARATLVLRRSLDVLNYVIKELASAKMPSVVNVMRQVVENTRVKLEGYYSSLSSNFPSIVNTSSITSRPTVDAIILAHICYKCLSRMAVWAWYRIGLSSYKEFQPWVDGFFESSAMQFRLLSELRISVVSSLGSTSPQGQRPDDPCAATSIDYLTRHIRQYGKLFRRMQQLYCAKFVELNACGELVLYYWSKVVQSTTQGYSDSQYAVFPVRFLVQAMVIFKECLGHWSLTKKGVNGTATFSKEFVEEAVKLLVTRFIPLDPKDLEAWVADPEEWANSEDKESEQWEYELRPCGERVLISLANQYRDFVAPLLKDTFDQIAGIPASDLSSIIQKEALYCAVGRCSNRLVGMIPFQDWIAQSLAAEANDTNPNYPILKRRIAWVIGKLVNTECVEPNAVIWNILLHFLSDRGQGTDRVVRFTAAGTLRECVDSLHFNSDEFAPFLAAVIDQLLEVTAEADTLETKRRITQSLNVVIECMGERTVPYIELVSRTIPELWTDAEGDFLYKAALLETVTKLVEASKQSSASLYPIVVPLLQECFSDGARLQLDQDGLELWRVTLQNAVGLNNVNGSPLLQLFPIATTLLSENLDLLGSITTIIKSYIVLDAPTVLQAFAVPLFNALNKAMNTALQTNQKDMVIAIQLVVQLCPAQLWAEPMHSSTLFSTLIKDVMEDKAMATLMTELICLFARMALNDAQILSHLIQATAERMSKTERELWNDLLDQWWRRFDNMSEPRYKKLAAMGIASLVATGRPEVLERLDGEIFNLWLDVFGEMKESMQKLDEGNEYDAESTLNPLITFWKDNGTILPSTFDSLEGTPEYERWRQIYLNDPVETQKLTSFIAIRLQQAQAVYGPSFETQFLSDADEGVLKQLKDEMGF